MINKTKIGKTVWYDSELWNVKQIISPNKYDDFMLISRKDNKNVHENGIHPVIMLLLDCHNNNFFPDKKNVRLHMKAKQQKIKELEELEKDEFIGSLLELYLSMFPDL